MFQFSSQTRDEKELLAIERRRKREQERLQRILDPKLRTMGVDTLALSEQIKEMNETAKLEKMREDMYAIQMQDQVRMGRAVELENRERRRQMLQEEQEFRKTHQRVEDRREFDLNDPGRLKKDKPARLSDEDVRCGVSSLQMFHGEDLGRFERMKAQQEQMKQWIKEQSQERLALEQQEKNEELLWQQRQEELNFLNDELERKRQELRALRMKHDHEFNLEHARSRYEREKMDKIKEEEDRLEEMNNMMSSEFLNEDFQTTINVNDASRFIPYNFKSLRPDQYEDVYKKRYDQLIEKKRILEEELREEEEWATQERVLQRQTLLLDRERERQHKEWLRETQNFRKQQSVEAMERKKQLDAIYANRVTDDFFSQFQTSSR